MLFPFQLGIEWTWLLSAWAIVEIALRIVLLGIIPGNRRPTTAMAWLLAVFLVPSVGFVLFLLFGNFRLSRRRREQQEQVNERVRAGISALAAVVSKYSGPEWVTSAGELNRRLGSLPMVDGNSVELIPGYGESLKAMAEAVRRAENFVNAEFYIMSSDSVTDELLTELENAAARGVTVRLLFDHIGTLRIRGYRRLVRRLKRGHIQWRRMLPLLPIHGQWRRPDLRNHRKILVIDGNVAFTGSQNLIEPSYNNPKHRRAGRKWVELMARLEGPIVTTLNVVFATDWLSETDESLESQLQIPAQPTPGRMTAQVVPSGPGFATENNLRLFNTLIYSAQHRISICSPYFVPDDSLLYAITTAAQRGVEVELFVSEKGDQFLVDHAQRSYYEALLEAGVRIYLYRAPYVLHAKHFTIDDEVAVLGSSNMDMRSFSLNMEVSVMLLGAKAVDKMRSVESAYREMCRELTLNAWTHRPMLAKYVDNVARLTATLQ
ncbi:MULTISPECIES: cardiolipin synthase [Arthrobacter]|uniref:Cardiolipin synthase n=1 Tax=Arthrobacter terricola TaxID=2547396 RepID=A0A4R5KGY2_9MICC|nr:MULTISPECIES: cardiolipin synthase [Arthrobacter]MBT8162022.1 cardiolipin synthase [Arthrobacter sp. GN70]TDF94586.1 cardiolipin synthase [Arthrobacter terricola]